MVYIRVLMICVYVRIDGVHVRIDIERERERKSERKREGDRDVFRIDWVMWYKQGCV